MRASIVLFSLGLWLANASSAQTPRLIRNCTPAAWQTDSVSWIRDVAPQNKVDDRIDSSSALFFDVLVNFNRCVVATDLAELSTICPGCTSVNRSKYISTVGLEHVPRAAIAVLRLLPAVAFIEEQLVATANLDVSVPTICVTPGSASCAGNVATNFGFDGTGVTIAIMDTGVDNSHATFAGTTLVGGYDATLPVPLAIDPLDLNGHGTHVASIALGQGTAFVARGVAPGADLVDVKVIGAFSADVCAALEYIYDRTDWNVNVINMSFGFTDAAGDPVPADGTEAFSQLVDLAETMGIVVVVAAGNSGLEDLPLGQPATATRALTVAAADDLNTTDRGDDGLADYSSQGPRPNDGDLDPLDELKPEVAAPGTGIFAALRATPNLGISKSGTSMASPHVAGLAALIFEADPTINAASVKDLLISTAEARGTPSLPGIDPTWNEGWGWGLVNGFAAIQQLSGGCDLTYPHHPPDPIWLSPDLSTSLPPQVGQATTVRVQVVNNGGCTADGVRVHFGVHDYSASVPNFDDIGTVIVDGLQPGETRMVELDWMPRNAGHLCLKTEIGWGPDTDYSNNVAQRNLQVAQSPVTFRVQNTVSDEPREITFSFELEPASEKWRLDLDRPSVTLAGDDCPITVIAELVPIQATLAGSIQKAHIKAMIGSDVIGGVTLQAYGPPAMAVPTLGGTSLLAFVGLLAAAALGVLVSRRRNGL